MRSSIRRRRPIRDRSFPPDERTSVRRLPGCVGDPTQFVVRTPGWARVRKSTSASRRSWVLMVYRPRGESTMRVTLRYFDGCPNWEIALGRVREVLAASGPAVPEVELERVPTEEEAERLGFRGSPTVLVDGVDPFADETMPVGLACRVHRTERGLEGAPSLDQLKAVLAAPTA